MLAALNFGVVLMSVAAGGLTSSLLALLFSTLLTVAGVADGSEIGLVAGIIGGLVVGGWVAGRRSIHSHRFHGMVTGALLSFLIVIVARFGGSPASTPSVMWLAVLSISISGLSGWYAGVRKTRSPES